MGATGCTTATTGATMCCSGQGLTCVIASGSTTGTCMKPPTLGTSPISTVTSGSASGVVNATVKLASVPVASTNGGGEQVGCQPTPEMCGAGCRWHSHTTTTIELASRSRRHAACLPPVAAVVTNYKITLAQVGGTAIYTVQTTSTVVRGGTGCM